MAIRKKALRPKKRKLKAKKKLKRSAPKRSRKPLKKAKKAMRKAIKHLRKPKKAKRAPKKMRRALRKPVRKAVRKAVKARIAKKTPKLKAKAIKPKKAKLIEKKPDPELLRMKEKEQKMLMQGILKILSDASVRQNLIEIGGENALAIVRNFYGNCSDEDLAKKLKIKISDVRATLNKLHNEGLVNYIREKDSETGWYSYSWSLNHGRMEKWASNQVLNLNPHGGADGVDYYFCPSCGTSSITNFESATDTDFRCESCNRLLEFIDEKKMMQLYERR